MAINFSKKLNINDWINDFFEELSNEEIDFDIEERYDFVKSAKQIGLLPLSDTYEPMPVFHIVLQHTKITTRVKITQFIQSLVLKNYDYTPSLAFIEYAEQESEGKYRLSFVNYDRYFDETTGKYKGKKSNPKRFTFLLGEGTATATARKQLNSKTFTSLEDIEKSFSVEPVTRKFYEELFNWYEWAIKLSTFPTGNGRNVKQSSAENEKLLIRLITRIIFVWFIKQKGLIPEWIFVKQEISAILKDFTAESEKSGTYYNAILQNLFFATLNQKIEDREFVENVQNNATDYAIDTLYRDAVTDSYFTVSQQDIITKFKEIPFLNGGLFECLDRFENPDDKSTKVYIDGFSREKDRCAFVPNILFWNNDGTDEESRENGLFTILKRYNFTVEENTPNEQDISLDPELLGKIFENLLATYNPETGETARKQTGSFYTPREIVQYMVDESLIAHLKQHCGEENEEIYRKILAYNDSELDISEQLKDAILKALYHAKILDPACGSGAFPMGILQQMVHILTRIDPDNTAWLHIVKENTTEDISSALDEKSKKARDEKVQEIQKIYDSNINNPDYFRKLYLIENCIFGVDIQPVAVQISKLRFFISLIVEQNPTEELKTNTGENYGILTLPNLEAKFVCANTLIGLEKDLSSVLDFVDPELSSLRKDLLLVRHNHFSAKTTKHKKALRDQDKKIRDDILAIINKKVIDSNELTIKDLEKQIEVLNNTIENLPVVLIEDIDEAIDLFGDGKVSTKDKNKVKRDACKKDLRDKEKELKSIKSRIETTKNETVIKELALWDPYNQNANSNFFDSDWMFGVKDGFDIVIGNPPYVKEGKGAKNIFDAINSLPYYQGKMDIWYMFACIGIDMLKNNGVLSFIATNNWTTNDGAKKMREKVRTSTKILQLCDFSDFMIFESASIQTMVMLFQKNSTIDNYTFDYRFLKGKTVKSDVIDLLKKRKSEKSSLLTPTFNREDSKGKYLVFSSYEKMLNKIKTGVSILFLREDELAQGIVFPQDFLNKKNQLKKGSEFSVGQGIFVLNEVEKDQMNFTETEKLLLKPLYTTNEIKLFYSNKDTKQSVIYTDSSFKNPKSMNKYPNLKAHLDQFKDVITSDNKPYGLHRARDERFFKDEKVIALRKCVGRPLFSYADFDTYLSATFYVIKTNRVDMKYLVGLLNSTLIRFWLKHKGKMQGENFQLDKEPLMGIPIFRAEENEQIKVKVIVDQIISQKKANPQADTLALEAEIDKLVYELYGLTEEEVRVVEGT